MAEGARIFRMFGLRFIACSLIDATAIVIDAAVRRQRCVVITPNVDHIVVTRRNPEIRRLYEAADFIFADGMPLVWLSKLLPGKGLPERVTGADLLETLCAAGADAGLSIAIVGGGEGVAEKAGQILASRYQGLKIAGTYSPPFGFEKFPNESEKIIAMCREWRPDMLCLALGAPKQEKWASEYMARLDCGPILCFGASINFVAGVSRRAPGFVQRIGFEWFWRFCQDPRQMFVRYFVRDTSFIWYAAKELLCQWAEHAKKNQAG